MNKLVLYYPVRPHSINQIWGVWAPEVYARFGFNRHNGMDLGLTNGQKIYAPFDCKVTKTAYQPQGGGYYICLLSDQDYDFDDGKYAVEITFMHNKSFVATAGQSLKVGEIVALGDNTGFSTGSHTHMACKRVIRHDGWYEEADKNDAKNTFDQAPYFNGIYADVLTLSALQSLLQSIKGLFTSIQK